MIRVVHPESGPDPDFFPSRILDPGLRKAPDPDPQHFLKPCFLGGGGGAGPSGAGTSPAAAGAATRFAGRCGFNSQEWRGGQSGRYTCPSSRTGRYIYAWSSR